MTAQQVGAAVGRNPLCILVPCHRVIGSSGKLTGYAGGLERKRALLELEQPTLLTPAQDSAVTVGGQSAVSAGCDLEAAHQPSP